MTGGDTSFRHQSDGVFKPDDYIVAPFESDSVAKEFIRTHHYSGTYPAALQRYGLWHRSSASGESLVGVAVLSAGAKAALPKAFPGLTPYSHSADLGRFVLLDEVPANGESWFIGQMSKLAAATGLRGLTSFSDPLPRHRRDGSVIFPGHVGTIYQATNAVFTGRSKKKTLYLFNDGAVLDPTATSKLFAYPPAQGRRYVQEALLARDVALPRDGEPRGEWLTRVMKDGALRRFQHPGNLRYCFRLGTPAERRLVEVGYEPQAYPKKATFTVPGVEASVPRQIAPPRLRGSATNMVDGSGLW